MSAQATLGTDRRRGLLVLSMIAVAATACTGGSAGVGPHAFGPKSSVPTTAEAGSPRTGCRTGWHIATAAAAAGDQIDRVFAIAAASANDVWAVGERFAPTTKPRPHLAPYPLIEHWDGTAWSIVPAADPHGWNGVLFAITVTGPDDAWAVGGLGSDIATPRNLPLVEHWNGVSWALARVPVVANVGPHFEHRLVAVAAASARDVWALGHASTDGATYVNRLLHWNGHSWTRVAAPEPGSINTDHESLSLLPALAVDARHGSVWAGGGQLRGIGEAGRFNGALVGSAHGTTWVPQLSPAGPLPLVALAVPRPRDVWVIRGPWLPAAPTGQGWGGPGGSSVMRWDGAQWRTVLSRRGQLDGLTAPSSDNAWVVGKRHARPLVMHWTGRAWTTLVDSAPIALSNGLFAVTTAKDQTVLALGQHEGKHSNQLAIWTGCPRPAGN